MDLCFKQIARKCNRKLCFYNTNKQPNLLTIQNELRKMKLEKIKSSTRYREIYKYLDGKDMLVIRYGK